MHKYVDTCLALHIWVLCTNVSLNFMCGFVHVCVGCGHCVHTCLGVASVCVMCGGVIHILALPYKPVCVGMCVHMCVRGGLLSHVLCQLSSPLQLLTFLTTGTCGWRQGASGGSAGRCEPAGQWLKHWLMCYLSPCATGPPAAGTEPRLCLPPRPALREPIPGQQLLW